MSNSELFGISFVIIAYGIMAIIIGKSAYGRLCAHPMSIFCGDKMISNENIKFVEGKIGAISFMMGSLWPFFIAFSFWSEVGEYVYNDIIIGEDEESRIASWVV